MGPLGTSGAFRAKKFSSGGPSTTSLSLSQTHTIEPAILIWKVFHCRTGLSDLTEWNLPGLLLYNPPAPLADPNPPLCCPSTPPAGMPVGPEEARPRHADRSLPAARAIRKSPFPLKR